MNFSNIGSDMCIAALAGDGDAVIAVKNKIGFSDLIDLNGYHFVNQAGFNIYPATRLGITARQEVAIKVRIAPDAADDGFEWNFL